MLLLGYLVHFKEGLESLVTYRTVGPLVFEGRKLGPGARLSGAKLSGAHFAENPYKQN